jgi:putative ABC transport system permease protein
MRFVARVRSLWNTLLRKDALERELDDELRAAVDALTDRYAARGLDGREARRAALAALGNVAEVKDAVREARIGSKLEALLVDLRYAGRSLAKARALTAVIVATLALGIGANTAIFSVVHAMLVAPLPYRDADRLVFIWSDRSATGYPRAPFSGPEFRALREGTTTCEGIGAIWSNTAALTDGEPEQLRIAFVSGNFFDVLGAQPAYGRAISPRDSAPGAPPVILISWDVFQRRFGANPSIVGQQIRVDGRSTTLVGVMPRTFRLLLPLDSSVPDHLEAWLPLWPDVERSQNRFLRLVARMRAGVTIEQARADVAGVARRYTRETGVERTFTTVALQADDVREIRGPLLALFAGVGILLAIACVNVASLLIARAASRSRETALRLALGASRMRLLRQALVEGLLLTLAGAAAGLLMGYWGLRVLLALTPASLGRLHASEIDGNVLAFTLTIAIAWGLLLSLAPLTELFGADVLRLLQPNGRSMAVPVRYRTRAVLVAVQIAMSVVLLVSAGLLVRAFVEVLHVDPGFSTGRQLTFRMMIPGDSYQDAERFNVFAGALQERLAAIPGVTGAGAFSHIPYDDLPNWGGAYSLRSPVPDDAPHADLRAISTGLFEMLGVQLLDGRLFTTSDGNPANPVVIVDDKLARELWPGRSAVGQTVGVRAGAGGNARATVVGVVRHLRVRSLVEDLTPQIFFPWRLAQRNPIAWIVQADRDSAALAADVRAAVRSLDPRVPIHDVRPMADYVEGARATRRFTVLLAALFALAALVLTSVGVYGVLAYAVARRRHEFGVRRALGADRGRLMREVLGEGSALAAIGCAGGAIVATIAAKLLQSQLYGVDPRDPVSFGSAIGLILAAVLAACGIPAYRAASTDPMDALRSE